VSGPRLLAAEPGWIVRADVVIVGSGVAGLTAALHAADAIGPDGRVLIVTKVRVDDGSTRWAQGGVAAALSPEDSPEDHLRDTLEAGAGLCDPDAVRVLCTEGPGRLRELIALGAAFDRDATGELSLTREGGHHRDRIVHAGGDATGAEVSRALVAAVRAHPAIELREDALVLDLLTAADGRVAGLTLHVLGEGSRDGVGAVHARAVVLATGGLGQVYASTTNPSVATGDGVALALRAGAAVADLEFVQFHPTALFLGVDSRGQQPLISEALRGEGAFLVDLDGERVITTAEHPLADLAGAHGPRRPHLHARALRLRRGGLHRRARREPTRLQQPARGLGLRSPHRRRPRPRTPAAERASRSDGTDGPARRDDAT